MVAALAALLRETGWIARWGGGPPACGTPTGECQPFSKGQSHRL